MLYYDWITISEGTDFNKARESKECNICQYCYFLNKIKDFSFNHKYVIDALIC